MRTLTLETDALVNSSILTMRQIPLSQVDFYYPKIDVLQQIPLSRVNFYYPKINILQQIPLSQVDFHYSKINVLHKISSPQRWALHKADWKYCWNSDPTLFNSLNLTPFSALRSFSGPRLSGPMKSRKSFRVVTRVHRHLHRQTQTAKVHHEVNQ